MKESSEQCLSDKKSIYSFEASYYEEDECMICMETMLDPVTLKCGHNSCFTCTLKSVKK